MENKILVIDDDPYVTDLLNEFLSEHYKVRITLSGKEGIKRLQSFRPDLVLLDIRMPEMDGFEVLDVIKKLLPQCKIIMITANKDAKSAVKSMKAGAYDYIEKPFDIDEVKITIDRALESVNAGKKVMELEKELHNKYSFDNVITSSPSMEAVLFLSRKILDTDTIVLLSGESGTGKELIAKTIHYNSIRKYNPFIAVNISAIPDTLIESELFGYEKGSFTGANQQKKGKFELCNGGTIFLDEIGTMKFELQSKLLRVIQEKKFIRIGGEYSIPVTGRIIAATNTNLEKAVEEGKFRSDLYFRLNVMPIYLPALRERKKDIPLLIDYYIKIINKKLDRNVEGLDDKAYNMLTDYNWPGNVRELENMIERFIVMTPKEDSIINIQTVRETIDFFTFYPKKRSVLLDVGDSIENMEKKLINATLEECDRKIGKAADKLGITRKTLREKLKKFDLYNKFKDTSKD